MPDYAHSLTGRAIADWEPLDVHLREVAELAARHAAKFGAREWGLAAGYHTQARIEAHLTWLIA